MAGPLLYRPPPRWHVWAAISGAAAIHFTAIAIASIHKKEEVVDLSDIPEAAVEMSTAGAATNPSTRRGATTAATARGNPGAKAGVRGGKTDPATQAATFHQACGANREAKGCRTDVHVFGESDGRQRSPTGVSI